MASEYSELLRENDNFRRLWLGEVISFLGDWFNTMALYAAVQGLSDSAQAISAVMVAKTLPAFFISPIAGPVVDRFDRRKILLATDFLRVFVVLGLIGAFYFKSLVGLFALTLLQMCISAFVLPTRNAILPMILDKKDLPVANALGGGTWSIMLAVGAALGGFATEALGITTSLLIDAATFIVSAVFFYGLPELIPPAAKNGKEKAGLVQGLIYLKNTPPILLTASLKPMMALSTGAVAIIPLVATHLDKSAGPMLIGILFASRGLGALTGSVAVRLFVGDSQKSLRWGILAGYVLMGAGFGLVSISEDFFLAGFGYFWGALGSGMIWVYSGTLLQLNGDPNYHGRVFALEFGFTTLTLSCSSWVLGWLIDGGHSVPEAMMFAACAAIPTGAVWAISLLRKVGAKDH